MTREAKPIPVKPVAEDDGIVDLLHQLTHQGSHLAQQQVELIKAEVKSSIDDVMLAIGAMAGAIIVGIAGLGVVLMGLAYLLGQSMPVWLAQLIVGLGAMLVALLMYLRGRKKMSASSLAPDATQDTLVRAPHAMSGNSSGKVQS